MEKWNGNPVPLTPTLTDELEYVAGWYARNYSQLCACWGTPVADAVAQLPADAPAAKGIYTLDGRQVNVTDTNRLPKGLYIVGGCKRLVR